MTMSIYTTRHVSVAGKQGTLALIVLEIAFHQQPIGQMRPEKTSSAGDHGNSLHSVVVQFDQRFIPLPG
jgi:hypothetical protein